MRWHIPLQLHKKSVPYLLDLKKSVVIKTNNQNMETQHPPAHLKMVAPQYPDLQLVQLELINDVPSTPDGKNVIAQLVNS